LKILRDYLGLFVVSGIVVLLDQWTKWLVRTNLVVGEAWLPGSLSWLMPYARIVNWGNTGAAFGMFQGRGIIFTILAIVVAIVIVYYYPRVPAEDWWLRLALSLQFAGALGNLVDRITIGPVTDFISVGNFPVFNVADASITVGVIIMIVGVWWKDRDEKKKAAAESGASAQGSGAPPLPPGTGQG
jgi:signal peptidase II